MESRPVDPWMARDDAQSLMRAEEIRADKSRLKAAQMEANRIATKALAAAAKPKSKASQPTRKAGKK